MAASALVRLRPAFYNIALGTFRELSEALRVAHAAFKQCFLPLRMAQKKCRAVSVSEWCFAAPKLVWKLTEKERKCSRAALNNVLWFSITPSEDK